MWLAYSIGSLRLSIVCLSIDLHFQVFSSEITVPLEVKFHMKGEQVFVFRGPGHMTKICFAVFASTS